MLELINVLGGAVLVVALVFILAALLIAGMQLVCYLLDRW